MTTPLLPPNATDYEKRMAIVCAYALDIGLDPNIIRDIHDPDKCPEELLPYLAWARRVNFWKKSWTTEIKRQVIKNSYYVHKHKGTRAAVRRAISPFVENIRFIEWFNDAAENNTPGTFSLYAGIIERGLTSEDYDDIEYLIDITKPKTRHYGLNLAMQSTGGLYCAANTQNAETTTIYPYLPPVLSSTAQQTAGVGTYDVDTTTIYPEQ